MIESKTRRPFNRALLAIRAGGRYVLPDLSPQQRKDKTLAALLTHLSTHCTQPELLWQCCHLQSSWSSSAGVRQGELVGHSAPLNRLVVGSSPTSSTTHFVCNFPSGAKQAARDKGDIGRVPSPPPSSSDRTAAI
jgi:hypothetical protein